MASASCHRSQEVPLLRRWTSFPPMNNQAMIAEFGGQARQPLRTKTRHRLRIPGVDPSAKGARASRPLPGQTRAGCPCSVGRGGRVDGWNFQAGVPSLLNPESELDRCHSAPKHGTDCLALNFGFRVQGLPATSGCPRGWIRRLLPVLWHRRLADRRHSGPCRCRAIGYHAISVFPVFPIFSSCFTPPAARRARPVRRRGRYGRGR